MPTTTIRLPDELKTRVARAAERSGVSSHGFILEAIAEKAERAERRDAVVSIAEERYAAIVASGQTIPWDEMQAYLKQRLAGHKPERPRARKLTP